MNIFNFLKHERKSNIFVLTTGRSGSVTFIRACQHISNYTSSHESRTGIVGPTRLDYPDNHIEADNRLSWFLGRLDRTYGNNAAYIHLKRDTSKVAASYAKRHFPGGIIPAYRYGIYFPKSPDNLNLLVAEDYCDTVNSNIELFLKNKQKKMTFDLENAKRDFGKFWKMINAEGDFNAAIAEFDILHNASKEPDDDSQPSI